MSEDTVLKAEIGKPAERGSYVPWLLIGGGAVLLSFNLLHIHIFGFLWPAFIVGPGLLLLWPAYLSSAEKRHVLSFLAIPGAMLVALGALLFMMSVTRHFEGMAYAWTLILGAGVMGYLYHKRFDESARRRERAYRLIRNTVLAFMGLAAFFELLVFQSLGGWWPLLLIGLGIYLFVKQNRSVAK